MGNDRYATTRRSANKKGRLMTIRHGLQILDVGDQRLEVPPPPGPMTVIRKGYEALIGGRGRRDKNERRSTDKGLQFRSVGYHRCREPRRITLAALSGAISEGSASTGPVVPVTIGYEPGPGRPTVFGRLPSGGRFRIEEGRIEALGYGRGNRGVLVD